MSQYPHLFSPIDIGSLRIKNRVVMAAMGTRLPSATGFCNEDVVNYYLARAHGGTGLVIFQYTAVTPDGNASPRTPMLYDDRFIPGLRRVVDAVHKAGAKIAVELAHCGSAGAYATTVARPKSPSGLGHIGGDPPLPMTEAEIWDVVEAFGQAAGRAKAAGFDAVQIHGCHGYLVHQFLSPLRNRRDDEWGGDLKRRARFICEIARRMRQYVGPEYPILARVVVDEGIRAGITLEDSKVTARLLVEAGIDVLDVTGGAQETFYLSTPPNFMPQGVLAPFGEAIKSVVDVPVIIVGRITSPRIAEDLLVQGKGDMIALGRQLLADPEFARKAEEGRSEEIRECLACTTPQCHGRIFKALPVGCVINPTLAREAQFPVTPVSNRKRVLVVGAGPAGIEAALVAARRGHSVTLLEKAERVGGQLHLGYVPPHKEMIAKLVDYYVNQLRLHGVEVRTGCRADVQTVKEAGADHVIVATGGLPLWPPIKGAREHAISAWDVLEGKVAVGRKVAVIGGGDVGCEVAEYLAEKGCEVTILEMLADIAPSFSLGSKPLLIQKFREYGVDYIIKAKVVEIQPHSLLVDRGEVVYRMEGFDSVVLCVGTVANNDLLAELQAAGVEAQAVGDCKRPRTIYEAVLEGFEAGYAIG